MRPNHRPSAIGQPRIPSTLSVSLMLALFVFGTGGCRTRHAGQLHVAAAASLAPAFIELSDLFRRTTGNDVVLTFSSTSALTEQIRNGAPFDVFASADQEHIDALITEGFLLPGSETHFASGSVVLLVGHEFADTVKQLSDLDRAEIRRIAIANPELAPYGITARRILQEAGLWEVLQPKLVMGDTVGQAYIFVTSGNADAGIVARSVLTSEASEFSTLPLSTGEPPQHWGAILSSSTQKSLAQTFLDYLVSPEGRQVFDEFGFQPAGIGP